MCDSPPNNLANPKLVYFVHGKRLDVVFDESASLAGVDIAQANVGEVVGPESFRTHPFECIASGALAETQEKS